MNDTAYNYVDEKNISSSLICPICLDILKEPHTHTMCDSAFCRSCLLQLEEPFCPICRWTWSSTVTLDSNIYLPKTCRLIRNILDDLPVECRECHAIRRRADFRHICQPKNDFQQKKDCSTSFLAYHDRYSLFGFVLLTSLWFALIYLYSGNLFIPLTDKKPIVLAQDTAINIDPLVLRQIYSIIPLSIEYTMLTLIFDVFIWFFLKYRGEKYVSHPLKTFLETVFELFIILNLIVYSIMN